MILMTSKGNVAIQTTIIVYKIVKFSALKKLNLQVLNPLLVF